jgi:hypothetical protein
MSDLLHTIPVALLDEPDLGILGALSGALRGLP